MPFDRFNRRGTLQQQDYNLSVILRLRGLFFNDMGEDGTQTSRVSFIEYQTSHSPRVSHGGGLRIFAMGAHLLVPS